MGQSIVVRINISLIVIFSLNLALILVMSPIYPQLS